MAAGACPLVPYREPAGAFGGVGGGATAVGPAGGTLGIVRRGTDGELRTGLGAGEVGGFCLVVSRIGPPPMGSFTPSVGAIFFRVDPVSRNI